MKKEILLIKLENLKNLYFELKEQYNFYKEQREEFLKKTSYLAVQKKLEEVVEYSIKINRLLLKEKEIFAISYQDSFLKLKKLGLKKELVENLSELALFRNKLAHEYLIISKEDTEKYVKILLNYFETYFNELVECVNKLN